MAVQAPACANQSVPARVATTLERADDLVQSANGPTATKRHVLLRRASGKLKRAAKAVTKAAAGKRPKLSAECASTVREAIESARAALGG